MTALAAVFGPVVAVVSTAVPAAFVARVSLIALPVTVTWFASIVAHRNGGASTHGSVGSTIWNVIALPRSTPFSLPFCFDSSMTARACCAVEHVDGEANPAGLAPTV